MRYLWCCLLFLADLGWAYDLWVPTNHLPPLLQAEQRERAAEQLSQTYRIPIKSAPYNSAGRLESFKNRRGLAIVEGWLYSDFRAMGWTPVLREARTEPVTIYQRADQMSEPLVVGTVGDDRIETRLAPALVPKGARILGFNSPGACFRDLFARVDGCLARKSDAEAYEQKFGVALRSRERRPFLLPGRVLMTRQSPLEVNWRDSGVQVGAVWTVWQDFDDHYYSRLLAAAQWKLTRPIGHSNPQQ